MLLNVDQCCFCYWEGFFFWSSTSEGTMILQMKWLLSAESCYHGYDLLQKRERYSPVLYKMAPRRLLTEAGIFWRGGWKGILRNKKEKNQTGKQMAHNGLYYLRFLYDEINFQYKLLKCILNILNVFLCLVSIFLWEEAN